MAATEVVRARMRLTLSMVGFEAQTGVVLRSKIVFDSIGA